MLVKWGQLIVRARWSVLALAVLLAGVGATWGAGVFGLLAGGGYDDPNSSSAKVRQHLVETLGPQDVDILVLYSSTSSAVDDPAFASAVTSTLDSVTGRAQVARVVSFYTANAPSLVSDDRHATYAAITLRPGDEDQKLADYLAIKQDLSTSGNIRTQFGGLQPFSDDANAVSAADIVRAETLSLPVLLVLLVIIFGSVVAALSPLIVGGIAILGAFIVTRLLSTVTDVSTFAVNIITLIGLGLSIDYALFVVSRFRDELAAGHDTQGAITRTMATAGRTVAVSGLIVTVSLASLLFFPQSFLRSMAYGGMAAVAVAVTASLTVLPAWLAVLGPRINALPIPRLRRRPTTATATPRPGRWARLAHSVMRRPWPYLLGVLLILAVLAAPVTRIAFGGFDIRIMPTSSESRIVADRIAADFPPGATNHIDVLATGLTPARTAALITQLKILPGVTGAAVSTVAASATLIAVSHAGDPTGESAQRIVRAIRDLPSPDGAQIGVTGQAADLVDRLDTMGAQLPWMILSVIAVTLILMFVAFGSVVLPIKAVLMNMVSLGAGFGAIVFIFQEGHLTSWLGYTATGTIEPTNPVLMIAVLFGLATDYEVFLLSRIREEWLAGADNTTAVARGLQHTGQIITSAALLLVVVVAGFATGQIGTIKLIGVGMIIAIIIDATLVRALLVPATMRLLGDRNWWAPAVLTRHLPRQQQ
ncbi:MMPL family transporter [Kribbella catacumbae]|uniref:MMPL family transporter n=1 Tax=Kribbella catacumbae TaxID=460086 RepID=UPI00037C125C|nr:MMPL family transporter [Kribbella catacumbae]